MPLPSVRSGAALQCRAKAKGTGLQCFNPAATKWSSPVCRVHGARKPETIKRGKDHPAYRHGDQTLEAKALRSARLAELRDLEASMVLLGVLEGARWRGRKPKART